MQLLPAFPSVHVVAVVITQLARFFFFFNTGRAGCHTPPLNSCACGDSACPPPLWVVRRHCWVVSNHWNGNNDRCAHVCVVCPPICGVCCTAGRRRRRRSPNLLPVGSRCGLPPPCVTSWLHKQQPRLAPGQRTGRCAAV